MSLRDALRSRGHEVKLFSSSAGVSRDKFLADATCFGSTGRWRTALQAVNPLAALRLRSFLNQFRPEVVHISLYLTQLSPLILRELINIPTVYYAQWYRAICPLGTRMLPDGQECKLQPGLACNQQGCLPIRDLAAMALQRRLDHYWAPKVFKRIIAISQAVANEFDEHGPAYLRSSLVMHPGTVVVQPRSQMESVPTLIFAGRLVREKGVDVLLRAFAHLVNNYPTAVLLILGDGPARSSLERLVADLGICSKVKFYGSLSHIETIQLIRTSWCVCVPSLWNEPFGMIAAEAQMQGVPVVASSVGGLAEILIDGETGHYVNPGDIESLVNKLDLIISNPLRSRALGEAAHLFTRQNFSIDRFAKDSEEVLQGLLSGSSQMPAGGFRESGKPG